METEYLIVIPVEEMPVGTVYERGKPLPLHCTLVYWFHLAPALLADLQERLGSISAATPASSVRLISDAPTNLGPNQVAVHTLAETASLFSLRAPLFEFLESVVRMEDVEWRGNDWRPHVTTCEGRGFPPGSAHTPACLTLVERGGDKRKKVIGSFQFSKVST